MNFSDFFNTNSFANPHKIRYFSKGHLIGALFEPEENTEVNAYGTVNALNLVALTSLVGLTEINAIYKTPLVDASSTGVGLSTKPVYVDESGKVIECSREIPDMQGYHKDYPYCKRIVLNVSANNGVIIQFNAPSSGIRLVQFFIL